MNCFFKRFFISIFLTSIFLLYSAFGQENEKPIVVVIPSYNNQQWYKKNLNSLFQQNYENYSVIYIDDCSSDGTGNLVEKYVDECNQNKRFTLIKNENRQGALYNIYHAVHSCNDTDIIIIYDGDDWFPHGEVLNIINQEYQSNQTWLTYGTFVSHPDGKTSGHSKPFSQHVIEKNLFRTQTHPSHLRTFYAWLFKKIHRKDLTKDGIFFPMAWDLAMMFPMIEMAGERHQLINEITYVYNQQNPISDYKVNLKLQQEIDQYIRNLPRYRRLENEYDDLIYQSKTVYIIPFKGLENKDYYYNETICRDECLKPFVSLVKRLESEGYNVLFTKDGKASKDYSALISLNRTEINVLKNLSKFPKEKLFLLVFEPPVTMPGFYNKRLKKIFGKIFLLLDQYSDTDNYEKLYYPQPCLELLENIPDFEQKKFCALIASNKSSPHPKELYSARVRTIQFLSNQDNVEFDLYGPKWDQYSAWRGIVDSKWETLKEYKFCICYENMKNQNGYITEKIFDCFIAGCVPIYWGADNICDLIPSDCFIDRRQFSTEEELLRFMKNISKEEYESYLESISQYLQSEKAQLFSIEFFVEMVIKNIETVNAKNS